MRLSAPRLRQDGVWSEPAFGAEGADEFLPRVLDVARPRALDRLAHQRAGVEQRTGEPLARQRAEQVHRVGEHDEVWLQFRRLAPRGRICPILNPVPR